jgi:hypothetical protein
MFFVSAAEICGDSQNVLEISRKRYIPAVCVKSWLQVCELVAAKNFDFLRRGHQGN